MQTFQISTTPKYVGGYRLGTGSTTYTQFNLEKKPNWLKRYLMRVFLDFHWVDNVTQGMLEELSKKVDSIVELTKGLVKPVVNPYWRAIFETEKTYIHCETEDEANELLKIAHDLGYKWCDESPYLGDTCFSRYKENTCFNIKEGTYTDINVIEEDYKVLGFKDLNVDLTEEEKYFYMDPLGEVKNNEDEV